MTLSEHVKSLRNQENITQQDLARECLKSVNAE